MPKITCNDGGSLFFSTSGLGSAIVLIAGGFCDHHVWDEVIGFLSGHFQVIRYDHRGIGKSDLRQDAYTVELLSDDLDCLLKQLNIGSLPVAGYFQNYI